MFSVVIPVFNHERYVRACVLSAMRSRLVAEVLLLDDGSTDASYACVTALSGGSLPRVRDITPHPRINRGAHIALNSLVRAAKSEWIAVLNSDDTVTGDRFELIERTLRTRAADWIFGDLIIVDETGRQLGIKNGPFHPQYPFPASFEVAGMVAEGKWSELLANQNFIATTSNLIFRKSLFEKVGGFAPYRYTHDWDFALRAAQAGQTLYLPHPLTCYRVHQSNTIKESSHKVDLEVRAMLPAITRDFPFLTGNRQFQEGLAENRYLIPARPGPLRLEGQENLLLRESLNGRVECSEQGEFVYAPTDCVHALRPDHLQNALLALAFQDLDFVLISHTLEEPPRVRIGELRNHIVFRERCRAVILQYIGAKDPLRGHVARLVPGEGESVTLSLPFPVVWHAEPLPQPVRDGLAAFSGVKPVIFILPALFAVGGVERLMVEMMRQLRERYDFVVITVERLSTGHGSLHGQADGIALACFDLAELAPPELFLPLMRRLKEVYQPSLVWVPNGSPWQCDNASGIRKVFRDIPIVDQQVYDTVAGWVARYHEPGIQSYDRFVAINTKIRETFIAKYGFAADRIDLIYHSINVDALGPVERTTEQRRGYREKYRLPLTGHVFGWIGRLTVQKRPLEFLGFAARQAVLHQEDHFVMIGNGDLAGQCDAYIEEHRLSNVTTVRFSNTMGELFSVMSGLLSTSEYEGLPISMLEAIAMGVPVFGTDVGDVGLILGEYQCGSITEAEWNLDRYSIDFEVWRNRLPWGAAEAAPLIRARFNGAAVAALYEECFRRAVASFR